MRTYKAEINIHNKTILEKIPKKTSRYPVLQLYK